MPSLPPLRRPVPNVPPRWLGKALLVAQDESGTRQAIVFQLGAPSTASLPPRVWREAWRTVTSQLPPNSYGPPNGDPALRAALAPYLGRSRGLACMPED